MIAPIARPWQRAVLVAAILSAMVHNGGDAAGRRAWSARSAAFELFALSGFAIAQPLFDVLGRNTGFLVAHGMRSRDLILFALGLIVLPPLLMLAGEAAVALVSRRTAWVLHVGVIGASFALATVPLLTQRVRMHEALDLALYAVAIAVAVYAYSRARTPRRYLRWLWFAPIAFAVVFLSTRSVSALFDTEGSADEQRGRARNVPSVVYLVLDEFALGSILSPDGTIDAQRFPNLGRLARRSTWYPNATTNSNMTPLAVPAALTGMFPRSGRVSPPTASSHPRNLFSLLASTHDMIAGETVTSMCPAGRCRRIVSSTTALKHVFADSALLYLHSVSPRLVERALPPVPENEWGGFFANRLSVANRLANLPGPLRPLVRPVLSALADEDALASAESRRFDAFVRQIERPRRPTLWFQHSLLPHWPWHLTADGRPYDDIATVNFADGRFLSDQAAEDAIQRYLLQVKAVDAMIGRLMSRLDSQGLWDDTLLVVHADHGVTFRGAGWFRSIERGPSDLLPVPLFVKYPQQRSPRVDRRNVELVDILPTVADALDVDVPWATDGSSVLDDGPHRRRKLAWQGKYVAVRMAPFEPVIDATSMSRRIDALFGDARKRDDLYAWGPHRDLVGRKAGRLDARMEQDVDLEVMRPERFDRVDLDEPYVPARVSANLGLVEQRWVAVALNGVVAGVGRSTPGRAGAPHRVSVMLSPRLFDEGHNELTFYAIESDDRIVRLSPGPTS